MKYGLDMKYGLEFERKMVFSKTIAYPVHYRVHHISLTTLSGSYFGPFSLIKEK